LIGTHGEQSQRHPGYALRNDDDDDDDGDDDNDKCNKHTLRSTLRRVIRPRRVNGIQKKNRTQPENNSLDNKQLAIVCKKIVLIIKFERRAVV